MSAGISTHSPGNRQLATGPGTLAEALGELSTEVRRDHPQGGLLITVDEMQVASAGDLALLAAQPWCSLAPACPTRRPPCAHRRGHLPDRLFVLEDLPVALFDIDATFATVEPARRVGVAWHPDAAAAVVAASNGYPAHLQLFAHAAWRPRPVPRASRSPTSPQHSPAPEQRSAASP